MSLRFVSLSTCLALVALAGCTSSNTMDAAVLETGPGADRVNVPDVQPDAGGNDTGLADAGDGSMTTMDSSVTDGGDAASPDAGGTYVDGCFVGTPVLMTDFLNRCTTAEHATHALSSPRIDADGGVPALP